MRESLVRSRMNHDFGEKILKLSKNTELRLVDLTQIVVIKIIQDRFRIFWTYFRFRVLLPVEKSSKDTDSNLKTKEDDVIEMDHLRKNYQKELQEIRYFSINHEFFTV